MNAQPHRAATAASATPADERAHRRPIWMGTFAASLAPPLLLIMVSAFFMPPTGMEQLRLTIAAGGMAWGIGLVAMLVFGLPAVLALRRLGRLTAANVCVAAIILGTLFGAGLRLLDFWDAWSRFSGRQLLEFALPAAGIGAVSGLACGIGMVIGAGIAFRARR